MQDRSDIEIVAVNDPFVDPNYLVSVPRGTYFLLFQVLFASQFNS
jgi:hypothetical protein